MKKENLSHKGWSSEEISKASSIVNKKRQHDEHFSKIVFWSALIVIVFANIIVSVVLIPLMFLLNPFALYSTVVVLAGMVGFLYHFLITDIGHLNRKHHLWASIIVPLIAIVNMVVMISVSESEYNPWIVGVTFAIVFVIPSFLGQIGKGFKKVKKEKVTVY